MVHVDAQKIFFQNNPKKSELSQETVPVHGVEVYPTSKCCEKILVLEQPPLVSSVIFNKKKTYMYAGVSKLG